MTRQRANTPPPAESLASLRLDAFSGAPAAARARVLERLQANIAAGATVADLSPAPGPGLKALGRIASRANRLMLVTFALGAATGALLHAWLQHPRPDRVVYVDRPVQSPRVASPPVAPVAPAEGETKASPPIELPRKLSAPSPATTGARDLAAERGLLDRAQRALGAGDVAGAQRAIDTHARRFPAGILAEEREALAIKTLVARGRREEARKKTAAFRARFRDSLFQPSVDGTPKAIP
jgi:hypothetical protein